LEGMDISNMATMLLIGFNEALKRELSGFLQARRHNVLICTDDQPLAHMLRIHGEDIDTAIVDVSLADTAWREALAEITRYRNKHGVRPGILCVSTVYRGPRFELEIERKGARLVYA
jgi:hypothetical protein